MPTSAYPPPCACLPRSVRALVGASLALLAHSLSAQATVAPKPLDDKTDLEIPVTLTPFVVSDEKDTGYAATSTLAGTRLRTDLRDVGAAISVVTSQFMLDTGSTNARDILIYTTGTETGGFEGNFSGVSTGNGFSSAENTLQSPSTSTRVRGLAGAASRARTSRAISSSRASRSIPTTPSVSISRVARMLSSSVSAVPPASSTTSSRAPISARAR